jgi:hypothetical protein
MAEKTDFNTILSITGKPGLFKVVARSKSTVIVESLSDAKRLPVYASDKVVSLADITMYTTGDDMPLRDILIAIAAANDGGAAVEHNAPEKDLRAAMTAAVPTYDAPRVYASDLKKLFMWYNILQSAGNLPEPLEEKTEE